MLIDRRVIAGKFGIRHSRWRTRFRVDVVALSDDLTIDGGGSIYLDFSGLGHLEKAPGNVVLKGLEIANGDTAGIVNDAPGSLVVTDSDDLGPSRIVSAPTRYPSTL
jgi:hypothetical protein